jgi:hypothetical protein
MFHSEIDPRKKALFEQQLKRRLGAYRSTICEPGDQLQQALGIT